MASQYQYQPAISGSPDGTGYGLNQIYLDQAYMTNGHSIAGTVGIQRQYNNQSASGLHAATGYNNLVMMPNRPKFQPEYWRISPVDRTAGLGFDADGLDIAAKHDTGWQVSVCL